MKKMVFVPVVVFFLIAISLAVPVLAAELLDVKPVVTGSGVVIEVTADIPMTYTYYKVPGQARAVVDIADADPDKVEPLIVVNKGAVASIGVDKAMIGEMTVSRLVFNLVSETEIFVKQAPDRKTLTVSFGGGKSVAAELATPAAATVPVQVTAPLTAPESKIPAAKEEDDPLGLDEPQSAAAAPVNVSAPAAVTASSKPVSQEEDPLGLDEPQPVVVRPMKLEPIVPVTAVQTTVPSVVVVKGIVIGASFIDIQTNGPVGTFKQLKLSKPERLSIEIPGTSSMKVNSVQVKRFGVAKVRIGATPGSVRVVLDTTRTKFPKHEIVTVENGVRIIFK